MVEGHHGGEREKRDPSEAMNLALSISFPSFTFQHSGSTEPQNREEVQS